MATKNLARTAIEGGRHGYNKYQRRFSHREERAAWRNALRSGDDDVVVDRLRPVGRGFSDKLAPMYRWLTSNVGRPWCKVRSEVFARFDTRTTAGRHIVFDHLLGSINTPLEFARAGYGYYVDRHGILREKPRAPRERYYPKWVRDVWRRWLGVHRMVTRGSALFWMVPTVNGAYRQCRRLAERESEYWLSLPAWFRDDHMRLLAE